MEGGVLSESSSPRPELRMSLAAAETTNNADMFYLQRSRPDEAILRCGDDLAAAAAWGLPAAGRVCFPTTSASPDSSLHGTVLAFPQPCAGSIVLVSIRSQRGCCKLGFASDR